MSPSTHSANGASAARQYLPGTERACARLVWVLGVVSLLIALSNALIWFLPSLQFIAAWPGMMVVRANTGISLTFASLSLLAWQAGRQRPWLKKVAAALGVIPLVLGALTSIQYLAGIDLRIDALFAPATFPGDAANVETVAPGRMSLNASLSLLLLGLALAGLDWQVHVPGKGRRPTAPIFALLGALPACFGLVGYVLGQSGFTGMLRSTNILMHPAACLVFLALGILAARPRRQPVSRLFLQCAEGVLLRWLLPGSTLVLLILAWLIGWGSKAGYLAPGEGAGLLFFGGLILLFVLISAAGRAVRLQEMKAQSAAAALHEKERLSRSILETAMDGVLLIGAAGEVVDWNPAAEKIFGWRREEVLGQSVADRVLRDGDASAKTFYLPPSLNEQASGRRLELQAQHRDGTQFPVEVSFNALNESDAPMVVGFVRDITQAKASEQARRDSEERFRTLADNISQLAWMTDQTGAIVWYNKQWFDYTGTTLAEMLKSGWVNLQHPDHAERVAAKLQECMQSGTDWEDTFPLRGRDGDYRWFLSRARPIRDEAGRVQRWFGTNTDVTDQRHMAEQLVQAKEMAEKASQAKDEFLAALSHELRTPLTPVLLSASSLSTDARLPKDVAEELAMMERNVTLEARLIDDLLDLTRIAKGKLHLRRENCDGHEMLQHALSIIREEVEQKSICLVIDLAATQTKILGDPARLQQVFWNLLKNAVKFTARHGNIWLRTFDLTEDAEGGYAVEVRDDGVGFFPSIADRIFQPFEQEVRISHHEFGGLGLGLAIARAIVDAHGGKIAAHSSGPNTGATFVVTLPGTALSQTPQPLYSYGTAARLAAS